MSFLIPQRRFDPQIPEMIDLPTNPLDILRVDLENLRFLNRYFGGLSAVRSYLKPLLVSLNSVAKVEILDLATGSADHPIAIAKIMHEIPHDFHVIAVDKNPQILEIAKENTRQIPQIRIEEQDILALPYGDNSFDVVLCSLAIHHFSDSDAIKILAEMNRISRIGFMVNDLQRTRIGAWTTWLFTHATSRNPMTLHDSYLSVMRGFTPVELRDLAVRAGIKKFKIKTRPFFRLLLIGEPDA
jgi:SAM-dependent methyltransferase